MSKAIFIDIDGTLRNSNRELTINTINAIKKITKKGVLVILCSGRPRKYTEKVSKQAGASHYVITSGGGSIYDYKNKKVLYANIMNKQACKELYKIATNNNVRFMMDVDDCRVVNKVVHFDGSEIQLEGDCDDFIDNHDITQCTIADKNFEIIKKIGSQIKKVKNVEIKNQHKSLTNPQYPKEGTIYYDIANIESNKGSAIEKFCEILNIEPKECIVIGDGLNDLEMFKVAGYRVAMGNAHDKLKEVADEVTETNDEDGVAKFLEKIEKGL